MNGAESICSLEPSSLADALVEILLLSITVSRNFLFFFAKGDLSSKLS